jgi:hypothetical protein
MTDASNAEVDALNRRVQTLREQRGELDGMTVEIGEQGHHAHLPIASGGVAYSASFRETSS